MFKKSLIACICFFVTLPAWAQRGAHYTEYEAPRLNKTSGFNSFFDTEIPEKGRFQSHFPSFSTDYGVSDKFSLGTSILSPVSLLSGQPLLIMKARSRIWGSSEFQSTLSPYFLYGSSSKNSLSFYSFILTSNNQWYVNDNFSLMASMVFWWSGAQSQQLGSLKYSSTKILALLNAYGLRWYTSSSLFLDVHLVAPLFGFFDVDTPSARVNISGLFWQEMALRRVTLVRCQLNFLWSDDWLFHLDAYAMPSLKGLSFVPLPGVSWKW